jgi:uncharacterized lipoprotein YmbA
MVNKRFLLGVFLAALALTACASGQATSETPQKPNTRQAPSVPAYWTGNGADGQSIAVLTPEGRVLGAGEAYLPRWCRA